MRIGGLARAGRPNEKPIKINRIMLHRRLNIYKHIPYVREGYDPSNGGISGRLDEIEVFSADSTNGEIAAWCLKNRVRPSEVCRVNDRVLWGDERFYVEPVKKRRGVIGPMMGGNYAEVSGYLLNRALGEVLPIHDRFETQEENDVLSC